MSHSEHVSTVLRMRNESDKKLRENTVSVYILSTTFVLIQFFKLLISLEHSQSVGFGDHALSIAAPRQWNALLGSITICESTGALKEKVLRHICLNLLLIGCNLFSCIFVM